MKELLNKRFWQDAKKTFDEARAETPPAVNDSQGNKTLTFVLVHGAWHGTWCWKRVRRALQAGGHDVFSVALTGLADRAHLLTPQVNLDTHITDVVNLIQSEELSDVVLCGHSYGGCVISGVADRIPDRIGALVYLDAFVLANGQSLHDTLPPEARAMQVDGAREMGDGWKVPMISATCVKSSAMRSRNPRIVSRSESAFSCPCVESEDAVLSFGDCSFPFVPSAVVSLSGALESTFSS